MADIRKTPVLDDCQRAPEDPLSFGGRWAMPAGPSVWNRYGGLELDAFGQINDTGVVPTSTNVSYWTPDVFHAPLVECWGRAGPGFDLTEGWRLFLNIQNPLVSMTGYEMRLNNAIGHNSWRISRWNGAESRTTLEEIFEDDPGADPGDFTGLATFELCLFRWEEGELSVWRDNETDGDDWELIASASDSAFTYGHVGLGIDQDDSDPSWIEFGGGEWKRTQIYRYVSN